MEVKKARCGKGVIHDTCFFYEVHIKAGNVMHLNF